MVDKVSNTVKKLYIAGLGPGSEDYMLPAVRELIRNSDVLIGGERNLKPFKHLGKETVVIGDNLNEICDFIVRHIDDKRIVVLASGDPGLFSISGYLKGRLAGIDTVVLPGISSLQYLCSKLHLSWDDMVIASVHGRQNSQLFEAIRENAKVAIFTGGRHSPDVICKKMAEYGLDNALVSVGEKLSYPDERIVQGTPGEISGMAFDTLSIMIVQREVLDNPSQEWRYATPGISDHMFIRGDVPMTKEEIRAAAVSKLRLENDNIVFDIGAGTGSVSIECSFLCKAGQVYAIEKDSKGLELIEKNKRKFGAHNIQVINGRAPGALNGLPTPDRIFIGGSGGSMGDILDWIDENCSRIRVVINTVTIESTCEAIEGLKSRKFNNPEIINLSVSRSMEAGGKHLMQAVNPVYIISAEKGE